MYSPELFIEDLNKIDIKDYANLSAPKAETPTDDFSKYRQQFILLLSAFKNNDFENSRTIANNNVQALVESIDRFDPKVHLRSTEIAQPPFDFLLLTFMITTTSGPNHSLFIKLFHHYYRIKSYLTTATFASDEKVYLNDRTRQTEIAVPLEEAKTIVQARIDYISENIVSLLYSNGQHQLLLTFLTDFCNVEKNFTTNETTLSQLGRVALACGDGTMAASYFNCVKDEALCSANQGYVNYYGNNFQNAQKEFRAAGSAGPSNYDACAKYMGQFNSDPAEQLSSTKKQTAEDRTQWPMQPR